MKNEIPGISIVGAGNVAHHLGHVLLSLGYTVRYVCNRSFENGSGLADSLGAKYVDDVSKMVLKPNEIVFLCVSDKAIAEIAAQRQWKDVLIVHTSGSFDSSHLHLFANQYGAFYPFQTFRREVSVNWENIPLIIEGSDKISEEILCQLGQKISNQVILMNSDQRRQLHIAGVVTNNFVYYLLRQIVEFGKKHEISPTLLQPLLEQTVNNALHCSTDLQTGPARRGDSKVIEDHSRLLKKEPGLQKIYEMFSKIIYTNYHGKELEL